MEPLAPTLALTCVDNPARLGVVDSPIARLVSDEYGVGRDKAPFAASAASGTPVVCMSSRRAWGRGSR